MSKVFIADKVTLDKAYVLSEKIKLNNIANSRLIVAKKSNKVDVLDFVSKDQYFDEINTANTINSKFVSNENTNVQEVLATDVDKLDKICRIDDIDNGNESFLTVNELVSVDLIKKYRFDLFNKDHKRKEKSTYSINAEISTDLFSFNAIPLKYSPSIKVIEFDTKLTDGTTMPIYYVLDCEGNRIVSLYDDLTFAEEKNVFNHPNGMEIDRQNSALYVADTQNHVVRALRADFVMAQSDIFGTIGAPKTDSTGFDTPLDVTVSVSGNVFVIDKANRLVKLSRNLDYISQFGGDGLTTNDHLHLNAPTKLAYIEGDNSILVYDEGNDRIVCIDAETMKYKDQMDLVYPIYGLWTNTINTIGNHSLDIYIMAENITKYSKHYDSSGIAIYTEVEVINSNTIINNIPSYNGEVLDFNYCYMHFVNDDMYRIFIPYKNNGSELNPNCNIAIANLVYDKKYSFNKKLALETINMDNFKMISINQTEVLFVGSKDGNGYYGTYSINSTEKDLKIVKFNDFCNSVSLTKFSLDTLNGIIAITTDINDNVKANILLISGTNNISLALTVDINYILNDIKIDLLNSNIFLLSGHNNILDDEVYITLSLKENVDHSVTVTVNNTYYLKQMMTQSGLVLDNIKIKVLDNAISCKNEKYYIGVSYEKTDTTVIVPEHTGFTKTEIVGTEVHIAFITIPDINSYSMVYDKNLDLCLNYNIGLGVEGSKFAKTKTCIDSSFYQLPPENPLDYNINSMISATTTKTVYYADMDKPMMIYRNIVFNKMIRVYEFVTKLKEKINAVLNDTSIGEEQKLINISNIKKDFAKFDNTILAPDKKPYDINLNKILYKICPTTVVAIGASSLMTLDPDIFAFGNAVNLNNNHEEFIYSVLGADKSIIKKNPYVIIKTEDIIGVCEYFDSKDTSNVVNVVTTGIAFNIDRNKDTNENPVPSLDPIPIPEPNIRYMNILGCKFGSFNGITLPIVSKDIMQKIKPRFVQISEDSIRLI